jgi:hypothetical protein
MFIDKSYLFLNSDFIYDQNSCPMTVTVLLWLGYKCSVSPPLSFGSLFKRKEKKLPRVDKGEKPESTSSIDGGEEFEGRETSVTRNDREDELTITEALDLLKRMNEENVGAMSRELMPVRQTLENTLLTIGRLAEEMENEKVKVEDEKFKPSVESSRKILVTSLRKESSSDFQAPSSLQDARIFQERLHSLVERFGDVSGSHSKLLNTFMKKHTGKVKGEFDTITSLEKRTDKIIDTFEEERQPVTDCITVLGKTSQLTDSIKQQVDDLKRIRDETSRMEMEDQDLNKELNGLEKSSDYESNVKIMKEIRLAQEEELEFHKYLSDLISHVVRALTKYSYGTSKGTSTKLQILMDRPWKIFQGASERVGEDDHGNQYHDMNADVESYKSLLVEVRKAISTGKITLKDSGKTIKYFDMIIDSLPTLEKRSELITSKLRALEQKKDQSVLSYSEDLRRKLRDNRNVLDNYKLSLERLANELEEKKASLDTLVKESENCLLIATGNHYVLKIAIE